jgi:hypothetical protein
MATEMNKRQRRELPEWTIVFEDASSFRCIVESVEPLMSRPVFKIKRAGSQFLLTVDGADPTKTSFCSARLKLDNVTFADPESIPEEISFCLESKQILYSIDCAAYSTCRLTIEACARTAKIMLIVDDPDNPGVSLERNELSTFVTETEEPLIDLQYDQTVDMDLVKLRNIIKKARKCHAEHLQLCIYARRVGQRKRSLVVYRVVGQSTHEQLSSSDIVYTEDGSMTVSPVNAMEDEFVPEASDVVFGGSFPIEKIDSFVKHLHVRVLTAKVAHGMPLMLCHKLASGEDDDDHIRLLVAPRNEDD